MPAAAMLLAALFETLARAVRWTAMLLWKGGTCIANAPQSWAGKDLALSYTYLSGS